MVVGRIYVHTLTSKDCSWERLTSSDQWVRIMIILLTKIFWPCAANIMKTLHKMFRHSAIWRECLHRHSKFPSEPLKHNHIFGLANQLLADWDIWETYGFAFCRLIMKIWGFANCGQVHLKNLRMNHNSFVDFLIWDSWDDSRISQKFADFFLSAGPNWKDYNVLKTLRRLGAAPASNYLFWIKWPTKCFEHIMVFLWQWYLPLKSRTTCTPVYFSSHMITEQPWSGSRAGSPVS